MGTTVRRSACALSLALLGVLAVPTAALAQTQECPGGVTSVDGVCGRPSATPTPDPGPTATQTPDPDPDPTTKPKPKPKPKPTATRTPVVSPTPPAATPPGNPPPTRPAGYPTLPEGYPTTFPEGYPTTVGEPRPTFTQPTGPGLAAAPMDSSDRTPALRIFTLLFGAALIAFLLVRARVRRWMIGI
jgi:hypothetical protein